MINDITSKIGNTPLIKLNGGFGVDFNGKTFAKLESFNPFGSVKDRAALYMINAAEKSGQLKTGGTIIEPTSGNTGIALAAIGVKRGYRVILTMPETMSEERRKLLKAYGAELILTDGKQGMKGAIAKAEQLQAENNNAIIMGQFSNPANALAHYETTAPEIFTDLNGKIDIFIAGVGTGGTLTGIGKFLKEQNKDIKIIAVEPSESAVISGKASGAHGIQGIGAGFVPSLLDTSLIDEVVTINSDDAKVAAKTVFKNEGFLCGISSGAAYLAASKVASRIENRDKTIVTLFPDGGEKYLSISD